MDLFVNWGLLTSKLTLLYSMTLFLVHIFLYTVYADGSLCLDILQKQWSSAYTVGAILTSIQSLLPDPNPLSPANAEAAKLFTDNKKEYYKRVAQAVEGSWTALEM